MPLVIPTKRLDLILQSPEETLAALDELSPAERAEVSPRWIAQVRSTAPGDPWLLGFRVVDRSSGAGVGSAGFKGPPDAEGVVEVAYGIDEAHRGRGLATEAAAALTEFARADPRVKIVRAHTLTDSNASARVLTKCGFRLVGPVIDPDDGPVIRWERA